jgi:hypothetical protein
VTSLQEHPDAAKFLEGGFNLIHNGNNFLSLQTRYRKFHFETEDGKSIMLKNSCLLQHFQDILKPQKWGFWITETVSIRKGSLFDHERQKKPESLVIFSSCWSYEFCMPLLGI